MNRMNRAALLPDKANNIFSYTPNGQTIGIIPSLDDLLRIDATLWDDFMRDLSYVLSLRFPRTGNVIYYPANHTDERQVQATTQELADLSEEALERTLTKWEHLTKRGYATP